MADEGGAVKGNQNLPAIERASIATWGHIPALSVGALTAGAATGDAKELMAFGAAGLVATFVDQLRADVHAQRLKRLDDTTASAAHKSGRTPERLIEEVLANPNLSELAEAVLEAAALKKETGHRHALAQCLANGLDDPVKIDTEILVAAALRDLSAPHIEMLARISLPQPISSAVFSRWPLWDLDTLESAMPGMVDVIDPIMATLARHGLAFEKGSAHFRRRSWMITDFGRRLVLWRLMSEGLRVKRPKNEPVYPEPDE